MEVIRCPNPKCRRRILDDEGTETEWTVLEIKCQHCGKLVRLHFGPEGIEAGIYERKKRRRGFCCFFMHPVIKGRHSGPYW